MSGAAGVASNRFFRTATSKSTDFRVEELEGGGYRMSFFSPATNPGYGKRYVCEIDTSGRVIRRYKDTLGPEGLVERKWMKGGRLTWARMRS